MNKLRYVGVSLVVASMIVGQAQAAWALPPSNDTAATATVIESVPASIEADAREATGSTDDPNCYGSAHNVWYRYTPPTDEALELRLVSTDFTAVTAVFQDETALRCKYNRGFSFEAQAGVSYLFMIGSYTDSPGGLARLELDVVSPPPNDNIKTAKPINSPPFRSHQQVIGATAAPSDPDCFGAHHTVWFSFSTERPGKLVASTFGSGYDTALGIYEGRPGNLHEISCTDATGKSDNVRRSFKAQAKKTYWFMVGSQDGYGALDFGLVRALRTTATVDPRGGVHTVTGVARVSGTFKCSGVAKIRISGELRQRHEGDVTSVTFRTSWLKCSREARAWRAVLSDEYRAYAEGEAGLSISATAAAGKETARHKASRLILLEACTCSWGN